MTSMSTPPSTVPPTDDGPRAVTLRLEFRKSDHPGLTIPAGASDVVVLGRAGSGGEKKCRDGETWVGIRSRTASKRHARIRWVDGCLVVEDLHSKNGTWCNGLSLREDERIPLVHESRVDLGDLSFRVRCTQGAAAFTIPVEDDGEPGPMATATVGSTIDVISSGRTMTVLMDGLGSDDPFRRDRACDDIVRLYQPFVSRYVRAVVCPRLGIDLQEADEIVSRTWQSLLGRFQRPFEYDASLSFRGLLATACFRHAKAHLTAMNKEQRGLGKVEPLPDDVTDREIEETAADTIAKLVLVEAVQAVRAFVAGRDATTRERDERILESYVLDPDRSVTAKQIGDELGMTDVAVKKRAQRLRERLSETYRRTMAGMEPDSDG